LGVWKITQIILKNVNQITFYFVEQGPGRGSEDIKKECNVNCFDFFFFSVFLMELMGGKNHSQLKRTALKWKKKIKHFDTGKELEAHQVQKGRLSCDSVAPQVGSARSDSASEVKVNRRKTNRRKTRPYCTVNSTSGLAFR